MAANRPNPGLQRPEFFRIFGPLRCSAQGGWGGSAHYPDPTAQSAHALSRATAAPGSSAGTRLRAGLGLPGGKKIEKILFFFEEGCVCFGVDGVGCGNRLRRCGRRRRAGPPPPPMAELCEARGGALPGPVPQTGTLPGAGRVSTYGGPRATLRGVGPRLALANGLPPPHLRRPCAGLPSLALREVLLRRATYPPPAQKRRRRVPSQPSSPSTDPSGGMLRIVPRG